MADIGSGISIGKVIVKIIRTSANSIGILTSIEFPVVRIATIIFFPRLMPDSRKPQVTPEGISCQQLPTKWVFIHLALLTDFE